MCVSSVGQNIILKSHDQEEKRETNSGDEYASDMNFLSGNVYYYKDIRTVLPNFIKYTGPNLLFNESLRGYM